MGISGRIYHPLKNLCHSGNIAFLLAEATCEGKIKILAKMRCYPESHLVSFFKQARNQMGFRVRVNARKSIAAPRNDKDSFGSKPACRNAARPAILVA